MNPSQRPRVSPMDAIQLGATIGVGRAIRQLQESMMAQFETLNSAVEELSESVDNLVTRLESATVEDPAVQQAIDDTVAKVKEIQSRIDGIAAGASGETPAEGEPPAPNQDLPSDQPVVDHRRR